VNHVFPRTHISIIISIVLIPKGGLDENQLRLLQRQFNRFVKLNLRKESVLKNIHSQHKLTSVLRTQLIAANTLTAVEDLAAPFKRNTSSLADRARDLGLEPLSLLVLSRGLNDSDLRSRARVAQAATQLSVEAVLEKVGHLVAEAVACEIGVRQAVRQLLWASGQLTTALKKTKASVATKNRAGKGGKKSKQKDEKVLTTEQNKFKDYFDWFVILCVCV